MLLIDNLRKATIAARIDKKAYSKASKNSHDVFVPRTLSTLKWPLVSDDAAACKWHRANWKFATFNRLRNFELLFFSTSACQDISQALFCHRLSVFSNVAVFVLCLDNELF